MDDKITISRVEYERLLNDAAFLSCLEEAGVDNWEGYSYAWELFEENFPEVKDE